MVLVAGDDLDAEQFRGECRHYLAGGSVDDKQIARTCAAMLIDAAGPQACAVVHQDFHPEYVAEVNQQLTRFG